MSPIFQIILSFLSLKKDACVNGNLILMVQPALYKVYSVIALKQRKNNCLGLCMARIEIKRLYNLKKIGSICLKFFYYCVRLEQIVSSSVLGAYLVRAKVLSSILSTVHKKILMINLL